MYGYMTIAADSDDPESHRKAGFSVFGNGGAIAPLCVPAAPCPGGTHVESAGSAVSIGLATKLLWALALPAGTFLPSVLNVHFRIKPPFNTHEKPVRGRASRRANFWLRLIRNSASLGVHCYSLPNFFRFSIARSHA